MILALLASMLAPAWAVPVRLPPGETDETWHSALELAGLEASDEAPVWIEARGPDWVIHARDGRTLRTVTVPAPTSEGEREEIALIARALSRSLDPLDTPTRTSPPPPSPLAPPRVQVEIVPPEVVAELRRPAPEVREPERPVLPEEPPPEPVVEAAPPPPVTPPPAQPEVKIYLVEVDLLPDPEAPRIRRTRVSSPPMALAMGMSMRPDTTNTLTMGFRVDPLYNERWRGGVEVGFIAAHVLQELNSRSSESWLHRRFWDLQASVHVGWQPSPHLRVDGLLGGTRRFFRQQWWPVEDRSVPWLGAQVEVATRGKFQVGLRSRIQSDLIVQRLQDEDGNVSTLTPIELSLAVVFRLRNLGDPSRSLPTLPR